MVNMVEANIAGKPLQHFGQLVIGTALHRGQRVIPFGFVGPIGIFELMLGVEKESAYTGRNDGDWQLNHQKFAPADQVAEHQGNNGNGQIRPMDAVAIFFFPSFGCSVGEAIEHNKEQARH